MTSVLLIDDDEELAQLLCEYLEGDGFIPHHITDGRKALEVVQHVGASIVVLDVMMPAISGIEVLRRMRRESDIPVLMLTARGDESDRISGLDLGADDYMPKPCSPGELAARLRAILRRAGRRQPEQANGKVKAGDLEVNASARSMTWQGRALELTGAEYNLLEVLVRHAGEPVTRQVLSEQGLGRPLAPYDRAIDVHFSAIRQKIGPCADGRSPIMNIRGVGYQFVTG